MMIGEVLGIKIKTGMSDCRSVLGLGFKMVFGNDSMLID